MALTFGFGKLEINTDSQVITRSIIHNTSPINMSSFLMDCRWMLLQLTNFKFIHNFRETNAVADLLEKHKNASQDMFTVFCQPPSFTYSTLNNDMFGTLYHRQVCKDYFALLENTIILTSSLLFEQ